MLFYNTDQLLNLDIIIAMHLDHNNAMVQLPEAVYLGIWSGRVIVLEYEITTFKAESLYLICV